MRNYAIIAVAVLLLASVPWFLVLQGSQNDNNELENDLDIKVQEIAGLNERISSLVSDNEERENGLNERISSLVSDNEEREKNSAILQNDLDSRIQELNELNVRLSELASENEEREKISVDVDNEIASLENKLEDVQERVNALRAEIAVIQCVDCKISLNFGVINKDDPLVWDEASRWNEFTGFISGPFDPETRYSVCVHVYNPDGGFDDDGFALEYWMIARGVTDDEGYFGLSWRSGVGYALYEERPDEQLLNDFILSLERDENNVVEVFVEAWICENDLTNVIVSVPQNYYIKIPDDL